MAKILNTNNATIYDSAAGFESYTTIRYSEASPLARVSLVVTSSGKADLSSELGPVDARISALATAINVRSGDGDDTLTGGGRYDTLNGDDGNDVLIGGAGNDKLYGGFGDDNFQLSGPNNGTDLFRGGAGTDALSLLGDVRVKVLKLDASASVERIISNYHELSGTAGADTWDLSGVVRTGTSPYNSYEVSIDLREGSDLFKGSQTDDLVHGGYGNDTLRSGTGDDTLFGDEGGDLISGGDGDDSLDGGLGKDVLFGGSGSDHFIFSTPASAGNVDTIQDFNPSADIIDLERNYFTNGEWFSRVEDDELVVGTHATNENHRIIYDDATGRLYYDSDGDGIGVKTLFAIIDEGLTLRGSTNFDFV